MNLLEAIQGAGENWIRSKEDHSYIFSVTRNFLNQEDLMPSLGRELWVIMGEWEIVTPEQVLSERKL
jgi:hypothetical protein